MAIVTSGNFDISPATGNATFGIDALGGLTVDDGSQFLVDDPNGTGSALLVFGRQIGGVGNGLVTGNGSRVSVLGELSRIIVGQLGEAELTVGSGGLIEIGVPSGSASVVVGDESPGAGLLVIDAGVFNLSGDLALVSLGNLGGRGDVVIRNGGSMTLSAEQSSVTVSSGGGVGSLVVMSGASFTIEGASVAEEPSLSIGVSPGASQGTVMVSGVGSVIDAGALLRIGMPPLDSDGQTGTLMIYEGGTFRVGSGWIGGGGLLTAGEGTLIVDGTDADPTGGLEIAGGTLELLSAGVLTVQGSLGVTSSESRLLFEVSEDGAANGVLNFEGGRFSVTNGVEWRVSPLGNFLFEAGDSLVLMKGTASTEIDFRPWETDFHFTVDWQAAGFAYTYAVVGQSIVFTAINDGDGTGARDLQFTDAGSPETWFRYDTETKRGSGWTGSPDQGGIAAANIESLSGTGGDDRFQITGGDAALALQGFGGDDFLAGGGLADTVSGGIGEDWVVGGDGADTLTGGADADKFLLGPFFADPDVITDFQPGADAIVVLADALEGMEWADLYPVVLLAENFASNAAGVAEDDDDRIIYGTETGRVTYDSNGSEAGGEIHIATLAPGLDVAHNDFFFALG